MIDRLSRTLLRRKGLAVAATVLSLVVGLVGFAGVPAANASHTVIYTNTKTIAVPPASSYGGAGGGDGWSVAFSATEVFNVFHHQGTLQVACHEQSDASPCYEPVTVMDTEGHNFGSSGHPGMYFDPQSSKLYIYATREDGTAGVVCFDTLHATTTPFCGFTALTAIGDAYYPGMSNLSDSVEVGNRLFAYNYYPGSAITTDENTLLCFDLTTDAACAGQPFAPAFAGSDFDPSYFPEPQIALIGQDIVMDNSSDAGDQLSCFDTTANTTCSGSWPISAADGYSSNYGAPFPKLSASGTLQGFCLPTGTDECYDLTGASIVTPTGMSAAIPASDGWNGQAVVLGPRVYVANGNYENEVFCYDASTNAECNNFPLSFNNLGFIYTTTPDPQRPSCIWVNADNGSEQIQNFDAYTGGACGQGPIRVLASSFVVNTPTCTPGSYTSLQVSAPAPGSYTSGSAQFLDGDGNPLPGVAARPIDASTGNVDLTGLNLNSPSGLPQFLITLNGATGDPSAVTVTLTWTGIYDVSCTSSGATVSGSKPTVTGVSPSSGPTSGGTSVTINGTGFTGADRVVFGTTRVTSFTIVSDTEITVTSPPGSARTVQVRVHDGFGLSRKNRSAHFKYTAH